MKPVFYICACGCHVPQEKIAQYTKSTNAVKVNRQRCPDHFDTAMGNVVDRVFECQECGKHFHGCKSAEYCSDCRDKIKIENNRAYAKRYYAENPEKYEKSKKKTRNRTVDGKKKSMDCPFFGDGNPCGKICIAEYFDCSVIRNERREVAA